MQIFVGQTSCRIMGDVQMANVFIATMIKLSAAIMQGSI